ncbi:serine hydrolase domain-containing protein [Robiginitomaculum antarcticum]|uniref:serine hydrolase domain-containing protein n=1 Tax=Robiginitomaculum antarcticum TaxID=437507 RepID=UPI000370A47D|nr:serine hydrolase [Robiginitomaculum antarcticum]
MSRITLIIASLFIVSACSTDADLPEQSGAEYAIPDNVVYAWATFDKDGIKNSKVSGLADRESGRVLTLDDPVRIASISKLVLTLGVMKLVEEGKLNLDDDVSDILGWDVRNPAFPETPVTLRLLLSHTSSLMDDGINYGVRYGVPLEDVAGAPDVYDPDHAPGTFFRYSNLNFPVVTSIMERATGERLDLLMERLVFEPISIDACYNWTTCSDEKIASAVVMYKLDGQVYLDDLKGIRPPCPIRVKKGHHCDLEKYVPGENGALFSPQGGLRISVRDLTTVGQVLLNEGRYNGQVFLTPESVMEMQAPQWQYNGKNGEIDAETIGDTDRGFYCTYGLATQILPTPVRGCADDLAKGEEWSGHAGDAYGLRSGLWVDMSKKTGIAYFAINNGDAPQKGDSAYRAIEEILASNYEK